ncbi:MAG: metalloregulator ArsR/SmtB family transcription factor, partial [Pseudomonadota bacterium]|nr:metalloregulator ArsR/SmtB family transcription factor [Pseudomonadota bacterium]
EDTRLRILALCAQTELSVSEITSILNQSQPRVSRHLKLLVEAGLLDRFREGQWAFYRASEKDLPNGFAPALLALIPFDDPVFERDRARLEMVRQERASKAEAFFKENAAEWDGIRRLHVDDASVEEAVLELLPDRPGWEHLDIGTGTGRILKIISPKAKRAVGIDLSLEMLTVARSTLAGPEFANCRVRHGDMQQLPLDDDSFDVVTFHLVLHYAERPELVFSEATRPLRPGGKVIVVDFAPHDESHLRTEHAHRWLGFTDNEMHNWFAHAGLVPEDTILLAGNPLTVSIWSAIKPGNDHVSANIANAERTSPWF